MSKVFEHLNVLAICLLGGVLAAVFVVQIWPRGRALAQAGAPEDEQWLWPKTLQVYPTHPDDPVKLVKITKGGEELVPGEYEMPLIVGDVFEISDGSRAWVKDMSFTLRSQTSKNIVSVGIAYVIPMRRTDIECAQPTLERWCVGHPHWCDGGCPILVENTAQWGLIPPMTKSGLEARYRPEYKGRYGDRIPLEGGASLQLRPGEEIELSQAGRVDSEGGEFTDPRVSFKYGSRILLQEGIEEAKDAKPCVERRTSKTGCAFAEIQKFNFGVSIVYFEDGTIWGNYGFGYARPNPDGIYTRVGAHGFPHAGSSSSPEQ